MYKAHHVRTTFESLDVEKVHAVVAQSTFASQNVQNTPWSDHFGSWHVEKNACRRGAKHISMSKCTKHTMFGPLLKVEMLKKCTPLWREAHLQVKMCKTHHDRTTLEVDMWKKNACRRGAKHISMSKCTKHTMFGPLLKVEMLKKCTPLWREAHFQVKSAKIWGGKEHCWTFRCRFAWHVQGIVHLAKKWAETWGFCRSFNYNHHYITTTTTSTTTTTTTNYNYVTLCYTTLITLHYSTPHYTTPHHATLH